MDRPFTDSKSFLSLTNEKQVEKIESLREKRRNLQIKKLKRQRKIKMPKLELISQTHKLFYLGLPPELRKLFI